MGEQLLFFTDFLLTERETNNERPTGCVEVDTRNEYTIAEEWSGTRICAVLFKAESDGEVYLMI